MKQGNSLVQSKKLDLPSGVNALNFAWLPGTPGKETEKLVVLTDEERLRVFSDKGSQLNQTDEKFSGSAIGIAERIGLKDGFIRWTNEMRDQNGAVKMTHGAMFLVERRPA